MRSLACAQATAQESPGEPPPRPDGSLDAPDEVHWTVLAADSIGFDWRGGGYAISFWHDGNPPATEPATRVQPASAHTGDHRTATLIGLAADSAYRYRIEGQPSGNEHSFRTPATSCAAEFTFAAEGDIGASTRSPDAPAVQRLVAQAKPRFVLGLGDLAYANGSELLVHTHLDDVMVWSRDAAYIPAWGNHDWMYGVGDDLAMYKDCFTLPNDSASPGAPAAGCCGKDWSWFDYGCLCVISYPEPYRRAGATGRPRSDRCSRPPRRTLAFDSSSPPDIVRPTPPADTTGKSGSGGSSTTSPSASTST